MEVPEFAKKYHGRQCFVHPDSAGFFQGAEGKLPICFLAPELLVEHLTDNYYDEMLGCLSCANADGEWNDEELIPIAAVLYEGESLGKGRLMFEFAFSYLFWDAKLKRIVYTFSDDWDRANSIQSLDAIKIVVAGE